MSVELEKSCMFLKSIKNAHVEHFKCLVFFLIKFQELCV